MKPVEWKYGFKIMPKGIKPVRRRVIHWRGRRFVYFGTAEEVAAHRWCETLHDVVAVRMAEINQKLINQVIYGGPL